ncbi:glycoside hydrolase family 16 protein [Saccharata proteae CBS 121410]|uniref:Glycoside hydrolase family 16 protein n=1 Tax=Saccharata proteae CBS 121410 TaxID=1314787 RepID=A0A9P4HWN7_9PEZI|nr:glycoside hydrolase family 16 protein [Saccharata proteae CBS 121410]
MPGVSAIAALVLLLASLFVRPACECGYSVNQTTDTDHAVWTEIWETDFLHVSNVSWYAANTGWTLQTYNITPEAARGPNGKMATLDNVRANPINNSWDWAGPAKYGGDAGLQVWVRSQTVDDMIPMGEIDGQHTDMLYGSFRVAMKITGNPGTCGAFFWFRNDTQEIDMEFLSQQLNATSNPVNLVLQSPMSEDAGFNAAGTPDYDLFPLDFRPDEGFHEYRFDWLPDRVSFYADGQWLRDMTTTLPNSPGHLVLNHWSNGDPNWSAGPPSEDSVMTVSYVKAYYNSSLPNRAKDYELRCTSNGTYPVGSRICQIPDQTTAPDTQGREQQRQWA